MKGITIAFFVTIAAIVLANLPSNPSAKAPPPQYAFQLDPKTAGPQSSEDKTPKMTPQQAARFYGFEHCNLEGSARGLGMTERELAAWLIAGIKVGIKPC